MRSHEQSMEYMDATIAFSVKYEKLGRIDTELACQVNQCKRHWQSLLSATLASVINFVAQRGLASNNIMKLLA